MDICITGHRPNKLYGYDLGNYRWQLLKNKIENQLVQHKCKRFRCGMALGVDTIAAMACIDLKESGFDIELIACIPFLGQESVWPAESRYQYYSLLDKCDDKVIVCKGGYASYKMQERNRYMVDNSDLVLAVWNGSNGGTANCIRYAEEKNKEIINLLQVD